MVSVKLACTDVLWSRPSWLCLSQWLWPEASHQVFLLLCVFCLCCSSDVLILRTVVWLMGERWENIKPHWTLFMKPAYNHSSIQNSLNVVAPPCPFVCLFISRITQKLYKLISTHLHGRMGHGPRKKCQRDVTHWFVSCHFEASVFDMLSSAILVFLKPEVTIFGGEGVEPDSGTKDTARPPKPVTCTQY